MTTESLRKALKQIANMETSTGRRIEMHREELRAIARNALNLETPGPACAAPASASDVHMKIRRRHCEHLLSELMANCERIGYEKAMEEVAAASKNKASDEADDRTAGL